MQISIYSLLVILGCGLVTWLPRVIPFLLVRKVHIPQIITDFLSYIPLCILTALLVQSLTLYQKDTWPIMHTRIYSSRYTNYNKRYCHSEFSVGCHCRYGSNGINTVIDLINLVLKEHS